MKIKEHRVSLKLDNEIYVSTIEEFPSRITGQVARIASETPPRF
jgi:hypothetical protein